MTAPGGPGAAAVECSFLVATAPNPGAIAVVQLMGDAEAVLEHLTGRADWPVGRLRLVTIRDIDEALVGRVSSRCAEVMPHGGPRVVQRIADALLTLGVRPADPASAHPREVFPEATDENEAIMLATIARAQSPAAIDLLLDQPRRWRAATTLTAEDLARSVRLDRLVEPAVVVLCGPPNVGKSTLSNALIGRSMSIARDRPGTTRDYTTGHVDLGAVVVRWHDTPGLRATHDPIEARAIDLARAVMERAEVLLAITDQDHDWPRLPRPADLRIAGKSDRPGTRAGADLAVSGTRGDGVAELVKAVRDLVVSPADLAHPGPWRFDDRLRLDDPQNHPD